MNIYTRLQLIPRAATRIVKSWNTGGAEPPPFVDSLRFNFMYFFVYTKNLQCTS